MNFRDSRVELDGLQRRFGEALREETPPSEGFGIYHFHRRANFAQALALTFPVVERLVGEEFFRQLAALHQKHQPSRSGDLQPAGAAFASTLRRHWPAGDYVWIADVAEIEWAWQQAFVAADAPCIEVTALAARPENLWPDLRLTLHPSLALLESPWPARSIWEAHRDRSAAPAEIRLDRGAERTRVSREQGVVTVRPCTPGSWVWLRALAAGASLAEADGAARDSGDAGFTIATALAELFRAGLVSELRDP